MRTGLWRRCGGVKNEAGEWKISSFPACLLVVVLLVAVVVTVLVLVPGLVEGLVVAVVVASPLVPFLNPDLDSLTHLLHDQAGTRDVAWGWPFPLIFEGPRVLDNVRVWPDGGSGGGEEASQSHTGTEEREITKHVENMDALDAHTPRPQSQVLQATRHASLRPSPVTHSS